jgi:hypothetical protein
MKKIIIPLIAITASVLYIRHCIKDAMKPPTEVSRREYYHDTSTDDYWEIEPDPYDSCDIHDST